eukprot:169522_1
MILITTFLLTVVNFVNGNDWFYLAHGAGAPVRCVPGGNGIECASDDGVNCKWGTYGAQTPYSQMSGVTASNPLAISCPGWVPTDGSNACAVLGCSDEDPSVETTISPSKYPSKYPTFNPTKSPTVNPTSDPTIH